MIDLRAAMRTSRIVFFATIICAWLPAVSLGTRARAPAPAVGQGQVIARDRIGGNLLSPTAPADGNYLANAGLEGDYSYRLDPYTGVWAGELEVASGWHVWYDKRQACPPAEPHCNPLSYNRRPEYKPETLTNRVRSGLSSQKYFTTYGTHTAGMYQQTVVPPESWVRFSIWVWVWSSSKDIPAHSFLPGAYGTAIGIDPSGGEVWDSGAIRWSTPVTLTDQWIRLDIEAYTESGIVSVWTRGAPIYPVKHNDSYWDDAELVVLGIEPDPTPTMTPTRTPRPTPEPTPEGHTPTPCDYWAVTWSAELVEPLADWGMDAGSGHIRLDQHGLHLVNGSSAGESFPLIWLSRPLPTERRSRLTFRFAFDTFTYP